MSRLDFTCLFCGEVLARVKPQAGSIKPLGCVAYRRVAIDRIRVTCPKCGEDRDFELRPKEHLKPAA